MIDLYNSWDSLQSCLGSLVIDLYNSEDSLESSFGITCDRSLSYTYTSIALDTRLLAQAYRPSQIELSSPGIQKSSRGLIRGLIPGLIFFCPALPISCSRPGEKTVNICKRFVKNKGSGRILAYFYLIPTKTALKTLLKH